MSEFQYDDLFNQPLEEEDLERQPSTLYDGYASPPPLALPEVGAPSPADDAKKKVVEDYLKEKREKAAKDASGGSEFKSKLLEGYNTAASEDDLNAAKERKRNMDMFAAAGEGALALFSKPRAKVPYVQHWKDTSAPKFADPGNGVSLDLAAISKDGQVGVDDAKLKRKEAIEQYLMRDKLTQEDKTRFKAETKEAALRNPDSEESNMARALAKKYYPEMDVEGKTAEQLQPVMDYLQKIYQVDQARLSRKESAAQREQDRKDKNDTDAKQKAEELEIPGHGRARSKEEAKDLRTAVVDTKSAIRDLQAVKELGKNIAVWDRSRINQLNQKLDIAVGKLRLSMVGPGAMTEVERRTIRDSIGDPSTLFSTEDIQNGKLDALIESISQRLEDEIAQKVVSSESVPAVANKDAPPAGDKPAWAK
jgi:hypothetical protein